MKREYEKRNFQKRASFEAKPIQPLFDFESLEHQLSIGYIL